MSRIRRINGLAKAMALFALLLWAQLVLGTVLSTWRYSLIKLYGWEVYPSGVTVEYDEFLRLANITIPADSVIAYVSPTNDLYTARFARMHYFLYPHKLIWLGIGPRESELSRWVPVRLGEGEFRQLVTDNHVSALLVDSIAERLPVQGKRIDWRQGDYILLVDR